MNDYGREPDLVQVVMPARDQATDLPGLFERGTEVTARVWVRNKPPFQGLPNLMEISARDFMDGNSYAIVLDFQGVMNLRDFLFQFDMSGGDPV